MLECRQVDVLLVVPIIRQCVFFCDVIVGCTIFYCWFLVCLTMAHSFAVPSRCYRNPSSPICLAHHAVLANPTTANRKKKLRKFVVKCNRKRANNVRLQTKCRLWKNVLQKSQYFPAQCLEKVRSWCLYFAGPLLRKLEDDDRKNCGKGWRNKQCRKRRKKINKVSGKMERCEKNPYCIR